MPRALWTPGMTIKLSFNTVSSWETTLQAKDYTEAENSSKFRMRTTVRPSALGEDWPRLRSSSWDRESQAWLSFLEALGSFPKPRFPGWALPLQLYSSMVRPGSLMAKRKSWKSPRNKCWAAVTWQAYSVFRTKEHWRLAHTWTCIQRKMERRDKDVIKQIQWTIHSRI